MQGFNMGRYVPPDVEGTITGNALNKKHALGARASKLRSEGILVVRFEMPFGVWCGTCPKPTLIGQGVRFNAEKKKVGAYYSTPVWSFRMRHADCGGAIEIRTDPANAEYLVTEGGRRRDTGDDKDDSLVSSGIPILTEKEREGLRNDAFSRLEKTIEDRGVLIERSHRIAALEDASHRTWEDPYAQNRRLRAAFRAGRKARERDAASTEALQARMSLGIDIVPATEEDARRAALVDFGVAAALRGPESSDSGDDDGAANPKAKIRDPALTRPLFGTTLPSGSRATTLEKHGRAANPKRAAQRSKHHQKSETKASRVRESLASTITRNTRASQDPFLVSAVSISEPRTVGRGGEETVAKANSRIQGIKRKRPEADIRPPSIAMSMPTSAPESTPTPNNHTKAETRIDRERGEIRDVRTEKGKPTSADAGNTSSTRDEKPVPLTTALVEYDSD
ncbi:CWC16 protein [Nemania serpens]|nr:CWC16 protein [Nemania serpens]